MKEAEFSIVLLALLAHSCIAESVDYNMRPQDYESLYSAAVDVAMTCYGDPGNALGIIGDTDGSILKALRANHFIPVVLVNGSNPNAVPNGPVIGYKLRVFVIATHSPTHLLSLIRKLGNYIWWNENANFLIVNTRPALKHQCWKAEYFFYVSTAYGMLNLQFMCHYRTKNSAEIMLWQSNPFAPQAPAVWKFMREFNIFKNTPTGYLFARTYQKGGQSCESINFPKAGNVRGYPLRLFTPVDPHALGGGYIFDEQYQKLGASKKKIYTYMFNEIEWLIDTLVIAMNITPVVTKYRSPTKPTLFVHYLYLSERHIVRGKFTDRLIIRQNQSPIFAVTQHTGHKSQLDKILSVIDRESRIGMWIVYFITFLFFKFFLGQSVMPALLNLVRLTCNTGLTTLPQNVAPTLYLTALFMFVVTLQGIYTGNLATLLTSAIPFPNVQTMEDIPKLGYSLHIGKHQTLKFSASPLLEGHIVEIKDPRRCIDKYVLNDPTAVCFLGITDALYDADRFKLHLSRDPILREYTVYVTSRWNLLKPRIQEILTILFEAGLPLEDPFMEAFRLEYVDDDEVKKNTARRIMTFDDLRFAFVILGVGLLCSSVCFIGEIVVWTIRLIYAKRRNRVRVRSAWGVTAKRCSWFRSLNCRFNLRRLFSNRR